MEKERLKFCIERFDHYYDSVNNKCAVFLGLSTFIVGGLIAAYPSFLEKVNHNLWVHLFMGALISLGLAIMIIVIQASTPFMSKGTGSLHYFGSISSLDLFTFEQRSSGCQDADELKDLLAQVHQLSHGLTSKFQKLKLAGLLFTIQFYLFIPTLILLLTNLK